MSSAKTFIVKGYSGTDWDYTKGLLRSRIERWTEDENYIVSAFHDCTPGSKWVFGIPLVRCEEKMSVAAYIKNAEARIRCVVKNDPYLHDGCLQVIPYHLEHTTSETATGNYAKLCSGLLSKPMSKAQLSDTNRMLAFDWLVQEHLGSKRLISDTEGSYANAPIGVTAMTCDLYNTLTGYYVSHANDSWESITDFLNPRYTSSRIFEDMRNIGRSAYSQLGVPNEPVFDEFALWGVLATLRLGCPLSINDERYYNGWYHIVNDNTDKSIYELAINGELTEVELIRVIGDQVDMIKFEKFGPLAQYSIKRLCIEGVSPEKALEIRNGVQKVVYSEDKND